MYKTFTIEQSYRDDSALRNNVPFRQRYKNLTFEAIGAPRPKHFEGKSPKVTVITVTYNAEDKIENAIESVRRQTYQNIEYIIVDGNSTDGTVKKIKKHSDVVDFLLSEPDLGIYDAMNKGIVRASGEYIVILNSDDELFSTFVEKSIEHLLSTNAHISYCNYKTETKQCKCPDIDVGLLLTQLDIKHNTFLIHASCFDKVGLFDTALQVVSDAKWNRLAYLSGMSFVKIEEELVFYSTEGKSSAQTPEMKEIIINESAGLLREVFHFLDLSEARAVYTSNFNNHSLQSICNMIDKYGAGNPLFVAALKSFILFNFERKISYAVKSSNLDKVVSSINLCKKLGLNLNHCVKHNDDWLNDLLQQIAKLKEELSINKQQPVLHFARRYSAPSEPFIHNFLVEVNTRKKGQLHVMLCDERILPDERPYKWTLCIPWNDINTKLRQYLYDLLWEIIEPDYIVAHFALNGYWLYERISEKVASVPMILICHGIDVFSIELGSTYYSFIHEYAIVNPSVCFTAVSEYLENELLVRGIPEEKIFNLHNTIPDSFFRNRKTDDYFSNNRPLRILCVGRLIKWKGHDTLLCALKCLLDSETLNDGFELEIVYGGWQDEIANLKHLCEQLMLTEFVRFVEFIDFQANPEYYSKFDLFVLPSKLSDETPPKTETFGVALLEAIAAGLTIITTDAGGLPEVVGHAGAEQAMIVKGDCVESLTNALKTVILNHSAAFKNNELYAKNRLASFSEDARIKKWDKVVEYVTKQRRTVYHFCALVKGGAANSTINFHKALLRAGINSILVTRSCERKRAAKFLPNIKFLDPQMSFDFEQAQSGNKIKFKHTIFSIDDEVLTNDYLKNVVKDADIINLTWHARFLSSSNIAMLTNLGIPVYLTIRDMHPLTGGCHYFHSCTGWQRNCETCPQIENNSDKFPQLVFNNKLTNWNMENVTVICISEHTAKIVSQSPLLSKAARTVVVHNICDNRNFKILNKNSVRQQFNISTRDYVIGYLPSFNSEVKGHDLFVDAMERYSNTPPIRNTTILTAGAALLDNLPFPKVNLGQIDDLLLLNQFYSACDVIVVPSREETFSNTVVEALSCGVPVVGFRTGIMEELAQYPILGTFVKIGDIESMVLGLRRWAATVGSDEEKRKNVISKMFDEEELVNRFLSLDDQGSERPNGVDKVNAESIAKQLSTRISARKAQGALVRLSELNQKYLALRRETSRG